MRQLRESHLLRCESPLLRFLRVRQGVVTEFDWIDSRASSLDLRLLQGALGVGYRFVPQFAAFAALNVVVHQRVVAHLGREGRGRRHVGTRFGCGVNTV